MELHVCTIIARNYLPAARVLAKSFREHNAQATFTTLLVDDTRAEVDAEAEPFAVLRLGDLGIDRDEALRMAAIYDVSELCTAVKPWLLQKLLDGGATTVVYLDPDIKVYQSLEDLVPLAVENGIVLTPHVTKPMPRDGLSKSESEVLWSGIYNLGFIAVSRQAEDFLEFWKERLKRDCISDPEKMRFVDQRWVDFAPGLYTVHILRDTSYNVAYWNLDHRNLTFREGRYLVDGSPLHFFHFSGYSPATPYLLSKHQGQRPRILLSGRPDLARICDEYGADLLANGYEIQTGVEYGFRRLANGVALDVPMRRLYRRALLSAECSGTALPKNPLEPGNAEAFLSWLAEPSERRPRGVLSRYLWAVYDHRRDLKRAIPDPDGTYFDAFASWVHQEVKEGRIEPRLGVLPVPSGSKRLRLNAARQLERISNRLVEVPVPGTGNESFRLNMAGGIRQLERTLASAPVPAAGRDLRLNVIRSLGRLERRFVSVPIPGTSDERVRLNLARVLGRLERRLVVPSMSANGRQPIGERPSYPEGLFPGVRVAGYLRTESGVGELGRLAVEAVKCANLPVSTHVEGAAISRQERAFEPSGPDYDVNLVCVNADELPNFARRVGKDFFRDHYTIGLWAWEIEEFPKVFSPAFSYVDELWSISSFASESVAKLSPKPVYRFPVPILLPDIPLTMNRRQLGLPEGFVFLFCFDMLSIFERKNPLGLIEAFSSAFRNGEGPTLVIKVINGHVESGNLERLKWAAAERQDIVIMDQYLDHATNLAVMASCDCYVSLHRSEGFGLTLAEAMALAKPVIATGYSGNLDFMTPETCYMVPWVFGEVPPGCQPYPSGARWAEPDLEVAAQMMQAAYRDPLRITEGGRTGQGVRAWSSWA